MGRQEVLREKDLSDHGMHRKLPAYMGFQFGSIRKGARTWDRQQTPPEGNGEGDGGRESHSHNRSPITSSHGNHQEASENLLRKKAAMRRCLGLSSQTKTHRREGKGPGGDQRAGGGL
jgi:hypothetical protein